ncbi:MAG: EAL domain-containing protein [Desulfovibrio sp.]|uniref:EAL domain-containing protein n=1 Tax=Desulfovibrio sp. 7SRBS1 TaxID=3378064 RepID=UPI003B3F5A16
MTLRRATIFSIAAVFLLLVGIQFLLTDALIRGEFKGLEQEKAYQYLSRAEGAIEQTTAHLRMLVSDWAWWSDSYEFVLKPNQEYVDSNLTAGILNNLQLNALVYYDMNGTVLWSAFQPRETEHWRALPSGFTESLRFNTTSADGNPTGFSGCIRLPDMLLLVASEPILKSDRTGPPVGWLTMGKLLDGEEVNRISQGIQEPLHLFGPGLPPMSEDMAKVIGPPSDWDETRRLAIHGSTITAYKGLHDLQGSIGAVLAISMPRTIYNTGLGLSRINFFMLSLSAFVMGAVMILLFERNILARLSRISTQLVKAREMPDQDLALRLSGNDELAVMSEAMDSFVSELREGDRFLGNLLNSMQVGVVIISCKERLVKDINQYALDLIGLAKDKVVDRECHGFICPNKRGSCPVLDQGTPGELTRRILLTHSGEKLTILKSVASISKAGEPYLVETFVDITELEKTRMALLESEQKYRTIFMNTGTASILLDDDTTIRLANSEFVKLSGLTPEYFEQGDVSWTDFFHRDDLSRMREFHDLRRKSDESAPRNYEARFIDARGRQHLVAMTVAMIPGTTLSLASIENITARKDAERQLAKLAFTDSLTGLANRQLFQDRLGHAIQSAARRETQVAVMLCDLDEFKNVNDSFGHSAGDSVLRQAAERLSSSVRKNDTLARFGGDEFAVLVEDITDVTNMTRIAQEIIDILSEPFTAGGGDVYLGVSIGMAIYPTDGYSPERLVQNADMAMYRAKEAGKNRFSLYTKDLNDKAMRRVVLESELREAIAANVFDVFYQPKVLSDTGAIYGMEALIRWPQPDGSYRPPMKFIPFAEDTGMIVPLDLLVLEQACLQNMSWIAQGLGPFKVSVNLSSRHFQAGDTVASVQAVLRKTMMPPEYLELEITETALMTNFEEAKRTLDSLSAMGIRFSLDDFGTGYSSLAYLRRLPFNVIKIDKSFIDMISDPEEDGRVLVRTMLTMAHLMGLETVAEGVETMDQFVFLKENGCNRIQGYFFSPPLPPGKFEETARTTPWRDLMA